VQSKAISTNRKPYRQVDPACLQLWFGHDDEMLVKWMDVSLNLDPFAVSTNINDREDRQRRPAAGHISLSPLFNGLRNFSGRQKGASPLPRLDWAESNRARSADKGSSERAGFRGL
jgi:hypothetical protein